MLWVVDFVPFMAYALSLLAIFFLKRRYEAKKFEMLSVNGSKYFRWLDVSGNTLKKLKYSFNISNK